MDFDREQKIFYITLTVFLIGVIAFFVSFLSLGYSELPPPVWLTLILLDAGFIIFIILPPPGRALVGSSGRHRREKRWYPRTLADIVVPESGDIKERARGKIRATGRAIEPVLVIALALIMGLLLILSPSGLDKEKWEKEEARRLEKIYAKAGERLTDIEGILVETGLRTKRMIEGRDAWNLRAAARAELIREIDSMAVEISETVKPFRQVGIQIYSPEGERIAWGGKPNYFEEISMPDSGRVDFAGRTNIYTVLVRSVSFEGGAIVVDIPVEVNYTMRNRFLKRTGLGEALSKEEDVEVSFTFQIREASQSLGFQAAAENAAEPRVFRDPNGEIGIYGKIMSLEGGSLARLRIRGDDYETVFSERSEKRSLRAGLLLTLIVSILALWAYRRYGKVKVEGLNRFGNLLRRILVLLFFLSLIRFILLRLEIPNSFLGTNIFDPILFADQAGGGLLRTAGDFLITALFSLILVFGSIKVFRAFYEGWLERKISEGSGFSWPRATGKFVLITLFLYSGILGASKLVSRVVLNSNPRIIGIDVDFFQVPVLSLHLALLFSVSAIFIALIFLCRLVFLWGRGGIGEAVAASVAASVLLAVMFGGNLFQFLSAAALLFLSARIFPLLRKEEIITVMFSSFFLVLIFSVLIYGTADKAYDGLRENRIREMVGEFNRPHETWIKDFLPDICRDISYNRTYITKLAAFKESAAFEIWADSRLGQFDLPCLVEVYDRRGGLFSTFSLGIPLEISGDIPESGADPAEPRVIRTAVRTRKGKVFFYVGIAPIHTLEGWKIGRIEIKIPYFFENPELLAQSGRVTPEIFLERQSGDFVRRVDEPRDILVARVRDGRVESSSKSFLSPGEEIGSGTGEWFEIDSGEGAYRCVSERNEKGEAEGYVVGYRITGIPGRMVEWATVVSIEVILTIFSLFILFIIRKMPVFGSVTPDVFISRTLGFKQKLLLSFLVVSILPVAAMGVFSNRFIQDRYEAEATREASSGAESAISLIEHSIRAEAESFAGSQYLNDILAGSQRPRIRDVSREKGAEFTLFTSEKVLLDESMSDFTLQRAEAILAEGAGEEVSLTYSPRNLFGGVITRMSLQDGEEAYLYYRRRIDDGFIKNIARVLGKNVNIYEDGEIKASSQRDLFAGGFLKALLDPRIFADVALGGSRLFLGKESLGEYSYHVASVPILTAGGGPSGVLSVPLLFHTAMVQNEIQRTFGFLLGMLALLFAAAVSLGVFLAGKIFTPIAQLRGGTRRIMEGDLQFRLEAEAPDEIGDLVQSFNSMTEALGDAREELLQRQRYLSTVLENIATGVISTGSDGRIVTLNPAGEEILGITREEVAGSRPEEVGREGLKHFFDLFSIGEVRGEDREITLLSGDERRTIKAVVTSISKSGERLGTVIVFDDLTELIKSKKLSAWVEMARQIAHEVKNPLTPIKLSAQFMKRAYGKKDENFDEIFEGGIDTIMRHTDILRRIATEFSSFGKVSELKIEPLALDDFVREQIASYRGIQDMGVRFKGGGDIKVGADREGLRKIFNNLMENAIEAISGAGEIVIETSVENGMARLKVFDTGPGLPEEIKDRLFEPYFSTKTTGTGLGLAICANLVDQMGGEIILRNREASPGAEAIISLPLA